MNENARLFKDLLNEIRRNVNDNWTNLDERSGQSHIPVGGLQHLELINEYLDLAGNKENELTNIRRNTERRETKIYLFGTVGVGKSCVINSLLGENLFITSCAAATSCFVCIRSSDTLKIEYDGETEFFRDVNEIRMRIDELSNFASVNRLAIDRCLNVFWTGQVAGQHIDNAVELIDAPGIGGTNREIREIQERCDDVSIIVFVVSTDPGEAELQFIRIQLRSFSHPDVFVLVNKWDCSDNDDPQRTEENKARITKAYADFLMENIRNLQLDTAEGKIFFISSMEFTRRNELDMSNREKQDRLQAFNNFQRKLLEAVVSADRGRQEERREFERVDNEIYLAANDFLNRFCILNEQNTECDRMITLVNEKIRSVQTYIGQQREMLSASVRNSKKLHIFADDNFTTGWILLLVNAHSRDRYSSAQERVEFALSALFQAIEMDINEFMQTERRLEMPSPRFELATIKMSHAGKLDMIFYLWVSAGFLFVAVSGALNYWAHKLELSITSTVAAVSDAVSKAQSVIDSAKEVLVAAQSSSVLATRSWTTIGNIFRRLIEFSESKDVVFDVESPGKLILEGLSWTTIGNILRRFIKLAGGTDVAEDAAVAAVKAATVVVKNADTAATAAALASVSVNNATEDLAKCQIRISETFRLSRRFLIAGCVLLGCSIVPIVVCHVINKRKRKSQKEALQNEIEMMSATMSDNCSNNLQQMRMLYEDKRQILRICENTTANIETFIRDRYRR